jgi:hypothetical protein
MRREEEYRRLANSAFKHASEEESAQLMAQWKILGARYLEFAHQAKKIEGNETIYDPIPWDRSRHN